MCCVTFLPSLLLDEHTVQNPLDRHIYLINEKVTGETQVQAKAVSYWNFMFKGRGDVPVGRRDTLW